jgi:hypothetical protein
MDKCSISAVITVIFIATLLLTGCVEHQLTINTEPQGAIVSLNDEEIGTSPVTVSFEWYGDYNVRIIKESYETLNTHRNLKAPLHDKFPFDFFAMLSPKRTVDSYQWSFKLGEKKQISREELIQNAEELKNQLK